MESKTAHDFPARHNQRINNGKLIILNRDFLNESFALENSQFSGHQIKNT